MNRKSLTFRLLFWYCGLLLVLGAGFAVYTYEGFVTYLHQAVQATLATRADVTWAVAKSALDDPHLLEALMEQRFAPEAHDRFIRISIDGKLAYLSGPPIERRFLPATVPLDTAEWHHRLRHVPPLWIYSEQHRTEDGRAVEIETGQVGDAMDTAANGLIATLLVGLPVLLVIAGAGGYGLVRRALVPVEATIKAAEALTFNSPHKRLPLTGTGDQLDQLGDTLNRMLERLDHAYQHASRFSADAAHELRTPLTIMRGELEFIASHRCLPTDISGAAESALDETLRLGQIVESLMALSRLEGIGGKRHHWPVDMRALANETLDQMQLLAEEKQITLDCAAGEPVFALGDRDRLKQVTVNLLDNAIKYTPPGGHIGVDIESKDERVMLAIRDTGIGIAPHHHANVFERFFRVAPDRGPSGAGLGLAIVKSICLAHGGTVTVESRPEGGSVFRVTLPVASSGSPSRPSDSEATAAAPEKIPLSSSPG